MYHKLPRVSRFQFRNRFSTPTVMQLYPLDLMMTIDEFSLYFQAIGLTYMYTFRWAFFVFNNAQLYGADILSTVDFSDPVSWLSIFAPC